MDGEVGGCGLFRRYGKTVRNIFYAHCSNVSVEPIEKRPIFHFTPGEKYLSVGFSGCSMYCKHCQNSKISHSVSEGEYIVPDVLVKMASKRNVKGFCFTYNEPSMFYEYIIHIGHRRRFGQEIVLKTNGFANRDVWSWLAPHVDAYNVDIKGDKRYYRDVCGGSLAPVLNSIKTIHSFGHHLEISYLVTRSVKKSWKYHEAVRNWLSALDPRIPVHIMCLYPLGKIDRGYSVDELQDLHAMFKKRLSFVYLSNLHDSRFMPYRRTLCPDCESLMIERNPKVVIHKRECCGHRIF